MVVGTQTSGAHFCVRAMFSGVDIACAVNARKSMTSRLGMEVCQRNLGRGPGSEKNEQITSQVGQVWVEIVYRQAANRFHRGHQQ